MAKEKKSLKAETRLSKLLREKLGEPAAIEFQDMDRMASGYTDRVTNGQVIADKIVKEACKGERWAIELLADRTEGKPVTAVKDGDERRRATDQRLSDVTQRHLNHLAAALGVSGHETAAVDGDPEPQAPAGDGAASAARAILDLPKDGPGDPQDA